MQPSFDTWTSGFLFAAVMGLFLFVILLSNRNKRNQPIAFLILVFSVILFQYVLYWTRYENNIPYFMILPPVCYFLTGPLLYKYFLNLFGRKINYNYNLHFIPSIILFIPNVVIWLNFLGLSKLEIPFMDIIRISYWFISIHMIVYSFLIYRIIYKKNKLDKEYNKVRFIWAKTLLTLYLFFITSYISYYVLVNFSFFNAEWDYMISIMMSISIYTIGYFIYKEPSIFNGELFANLFLPIKNKSESFETALINELYENLTNHMITNKPYIDNELRLVNLADQLGFSTHLLSKVINKKYGKNFNTFVNEYRLIEAEELLKSSDDLIIKQIYFDVGFNNKNSFYKAFKRKNDCTPSHFKSKFNTRDL